MDRPTDNPDHPRPHGLGPTVLRPPASRPKCPSPPLCRARAARPHVLRCPRLRVARPTRTRAPRTRGILAAAPAGPGSRRHLLARDSVARPTPPSPAPVARRAPVGRRCGAAAAVRCPGPGAGSAPGGPGRARGVPERPARPTRAWGAGRGCPAMSGCAPRSGGRTRRLARPVFDLALGVRPPGTSPGVHALAYSGRTGRKRAVRTPPSRSKGRTCPWVTRPQPRQAPAA